MAAVAAHDFVHLRFCSLFPNPVRNDETTRPRSACAQVGKWFSPEKKTYEGNL